MPDSSDHLERGPGSGSVPESVSGSVSGSVEWVDLGDIGRDEPSGSWGGRSGRPGDRGRRPGGLRPGHLLIAVGVIVAVVLALVRAGADGSAPVADPTPTPSASSATWTPPEEASTAPVAVPRAPVVQRVGPNILGVRGGWELFGYGNSALVRVELAAGRVTTTGLPALASTGPVSFVVGADRAFVRPLDGVAAYQVVDHAPAEQLTGPLGRANVILPGPDPQHIWRQVGVGDPPTVALATLDGTVVGQRISSPPHAQSQLAADGAGYLYFFGIGGAYDVRAGSTSRVTTGWLLAVGPGRWVAVECDDAYRCFTVTIDLGSGVRRTIGPGLSPNAPIGTVAPDGSAAVLYRLAASGEVGLQLLDLASGDIRTVRTQVNQGIQDGTVVWASDSSRFFVVGPWGQVQVVDPLTGQARPIGLHLPALSQLAIRPAG